jgi:DNA-binding transcriptional MerR regulator
VPSVEKSPDALKTIGELSQELGVAQHILRYWETRFPQLRPMQRAGNRRYYRPADVELTRRIHRLLNEEGYTVKGVQKLLRDKSAPSQMAIGGGILIPPQEPEVRPQAQSPAHASVPDDEQSSGIDMFRLVELRNRLASALED